MHTKRTRWLVYTVMVALIPILARMFAWLVTRTGTGEPFASADFVTFGLVLHISTINEMEHVAPLDSAWRTVQNGMAITGIAIYCVLYAVGLVAGSAIDGQAMLRCSMILASISFLLDYIFYRDLGGVANNGVE